MRFCAMYRRFMDYTQVCFDMSVYYNLNLVISSPKVLLCLEKKRNDEPKEWLGWVAEYVGGFQGKGIDEYESPVAHHNRNRMFFHIGTKIRVYIIYSPGNSWSLLTSN